MGYGLVALKSAGASEHRMPISGAERQKSKPQHTTINLFELSEKPMAPENRGEPVGQTTYEKTLSTPINTDGRIATSNERHPSL
jgi:hypothetical protein